MSSVQMRWLIICLPPSLLGHKTQKAQGGAERLLVPFGFYPNIRWRHL
jgi:hypothetical protein